MRAATMFKPARSNLEQICPMAFFATASGLTMDKVRSTAMQNLRLDSVSNARNSPNVLFYQAFAGASRPALGPGLAVRLPLPCQRSVSLASAYCKPDGVQFRA